MILCVADFEIGGLLTRNQGLVMRIQQITLPSGSGVKKCHRKLTISAGLFATEVVTGDSSHAWMALKSCGLLNR